MLTKCLPAYPNRFVLAHSFLQSYSSFRGKTYSNIILIQPSLYSLVVIKAYENKPALDCETVLFFNRNLAIGMVSVLEIVVLSLITIVRLIVIGIVIFIQLSLLG